MQTNQVKIILDTKRFPITSNVTKPNDCASLENINASSHLDLFDLLETGLGNGWLLNFFKGEQPLLLCIRDLLCTQMV